MKSKTVLPNAPILVESTRSIGYSLESALADIIDNSISKEAKRVDVMFDSSEPMYIAIADDGTGMDLAELCDAMKYGSRSSLETRNEGDLGRFGLGLKMASLSQCRKLSVASKKDGAVNIVEWDLDYIAETDDWTLKIYDEEDFDGIPYLEYLNDKVSGTIVLWREFDRLGEESKSRKRAKIFDEKIDSARNHVALVFHRYLAKEDRQHAITIAFNNVNLAPIDPFMTDNPATQWLEEETINVEGQRITVRPYVLPYVSKLTVQEKKQQEEYIGDLKLNQGFYIYRNYRLIVWGTWFRLIKYNELKKLTRVKVDIPNSLDSVWAIDIKKSSAELPDSIKQKLKDIVLRASERSEQVFRYRGRKVNDDNLDHVWEVIKDRGKVTYSINRDFAFIKRLEKELSEEGQGILMSLLKLIEQTFPFTDVYCRYSKGEDKEPSMEEEEVLGIASQYIESLCEYQSLSVAVDNACRLDAFSKYPNVLRKIREVYGGAKL